MGSPTSFVAEHQVNGAPPARRPTRRAGRAAGGRAGRAAELVNNAVLHGGAVMTGKVGLRVDVGHERIRVEVRDAGLGFRRVEPHRAPGQQGGFGLVLVNDLATRWDVDVTDGTCVWFELERAHIASLPDRAVGAEIPDDDRDIASELVVVKERLAFLEAQL